jgi:hypothetical protein
MIRDFEGLGVIIRYCVWNVLERNIIKEWLIGRGKSGGSIGGGGMSKTKTPKKPVIKYSI